MPLRKHEALVTSYVAELGDRDLLDNGEDEHEDQQEDCSLDVPTSVAEDVMASTLFESEDRKSLLTGSPFDPNWVSQISSQRSFR